jgi:hypothetical protein
MDANDTRGLQVYIREQSVDVNAVSNNGKTLLEYAVSLNREDVVDMLVHNGADMTAIHDSDHPDSWANVLFAAAHYRASVQLLKQVLQAIGPAAMNIYSPVGSSYVPTGLGSTTPLHVLAFHARKGRGRTMHKLQHALTVTGRANSLAVV